MAEVLPLLLVPPLLGWFMALRRRRAARPALLRAIEQAGRHPVLDAGHASVIAVARSLATEPPTATTAGRWWLVGRRRRTWEIRQLVAPLGLELRDVIRVRRDRLGRMTGFRGASRFTGIRHGRTLDISLADSSSELTLTVAAGQRLTSFRVFAGDSGALTASGIVSAPLAAMLSTLHPSRHWRGVQIEVSADRLRLTRTRPATSWLHDLWLIELVADLAASPAFDVRAGADPTALAARTLRAEPSALC